MSDNARPASASRHEQIRDQVARINRSTGFFQSLRMQEFLSFVVKISLSNDRASLKESVIGVEVFGRSPDYDPKAEPIVRVEARRLRAKLERYYETDGAADAVLIELPKGGYQPAISFRAGTEEAAPPAAVPVEVSLLRHTSSRPFRLAAGTVVALTLAGAILWFGLARTNPPPLALSSLTSLPGNVLRARFSPDSSRIAFTWDGGTGAYRVYVKPVGAGDPVPLTAGPGQDLDPVWSPDGTQIAFLRRGPQRTDVMIVPSSAGPARVVAALSSVESARRVPVPRYNWSFGPSWSPLGNSLVISDAGVPSTPSRIYLIDLASGKRRALTEPDSQSTGDFEPLFSPRGDRVAFLRRWSRGGASGDIFIQNLSGGTPQRVTSLRHLVAGLTWTADGRAIIFSCDLDGIARLWRVSTAGGSPELVQGAGPRALFPSLSRDGHSLLYSETFSSTRIWLIPSQGNGSPEAVCPSSRNDSSPQFSPDGKRVVLISDRGGPSTLWICHTDGGDSSPVPNLKGFIPGTPRWSPVGNQIAFDSSHEGSAAIYTIGADGWSPRRLTPASSENRMPSWSHDGKWLYYSSKRSGAWQIWKQSVSGGPEIPVTRTGGWEAAESKDGGTLYFTKGPEGFWRMELANGEESPVPQLTGVAHYRNWSVLDRGLLFLAQANSQFSLKLLDFETDRVLPLLTLSKPPVFGSPNLSASPDGSRILLTEVERGESNLFLLKNFR